MKATLKFLSRRGPLRVLKRCVIAISYLGPALAKAFVWVFQKTEDSNFYYQITDRNLRHLNHFVASSTGVDVEIASHYSNEILSSSEFRSVVENFKKQHRGLSQFSFSPGRRIGWYQLIRITKPKVVLETGVHQGVGALIICLALRQNSLEGHPGKYFGTDFNPKAGSLIQGCDFDYAQVKIGDSIESINNLDIEIDFYISDSDHSEGYEKRELLAVEKRLKETAIVVSDNSEATDVLEEWSMGRGRAFHYFREVPKNHWYSGGGIGLSLARKDHITPA